MPRPSQINRNDQYTRQHYVCSHCGEQMDLINLMEQPNPQFVICNKDGCDGFMNQSGMQQKLPEDYQVQPGEFYLRHMSRDESAEVICVKIKVAQEDMPEEKKLQGEELTKYAYELAEEYEKVGSVGVTVDLMPEFYS